MEEQNKNKKIKLDVWGNPLVMEQTGDSISDEQLKKLREEIISDGINKRSYSSAEESEIDSDDELVMKFVKPKNKTNQFETTAYAFALNNKMSKLKADSARLDERMRYLQLDYSNSLVKLDEQKVSITQLRLRNNILVKESEKLKTINKITKYLFFVSVFVNSFIVTAIMVASSEYPKIQMT